MEIQDPSLILGITCLFFLAVGATLLGALIWAVRAEKGSGQKFIAVGLVALVGGFVCYLIYIAFRLFLYIFS